MSELLAEQSEFVGTFDKIKDKENSYVMHIPYIQRQRVFLPDGLPYPLGVNEAVASFISAFGYHPRITVKLTTNMWVNMNYVFRGMFDLDGSVIIPQTALCYAKKHDVVLYDHALKLRGDLLKSLDVDENPNVQTAVILHLEFVDKDGVAIKCADTDVGKSIYFSKSPVEVLNSPLSLQYFLNCGSRI